MSTISMGPAERGMGMRAKAGWGGVRCWLGLAGMLCVWSVTGQTLLNVDFGGGGGPGRLGWAATGQSSNDVWNVYSHYRPRFAAGMALVADGRMERLRWADGTESGVSLTVSNAPGVWGNATGDAMMDSYVFGPNGSNVVATFRGLPAGSYQFWVYGWAGAETGPEQNPSFLLRAGATNWGPLAASGVGVWRAGDPWRERAQYVVFRDVTVGEGEPVTLEAIPGVGGVGVLNGVQVMSRGTAPPRLWAAERAAVGGGFTNLLLRRVSYEGRLGSGEARFAVALEVESQQTNELAAVVFEGELAILAPRLPAGWRLVNEGTRFRLLAGAPGVHRLEFELVPRVTRAEPWDEVRFVGPAAAVATVAARSGQPDVEVQLLGGTLVEGEGSGRWAVQGVLGADREVALRWQGKTAEAAREAVVTVDSQVTVRLMPTVIRHTTRLRYEVLQSRLGAVRLWLPSEHTLTRLTGEQVKDWRVVAGEGGAGLVVEFLRPVENGVSLELVTEQPLPVLPGRAEVRWPQPREVQRESGSVGVEAEDLVARVEAGTGLRQVNAGAGEVAAFRYSGRPAGLGVELTRVEPVIQVEARVTVQVEESRAMVGHQLRVQVTRAGIYAVEAALPPGFLVTEVKGEGIEDWRVEGGALRVSFGQRVLGERVLSVQVERSYTQPPAELEVAPLRVAGTTRSTALIGAGSVAGLQLKTAAAEGAREIPVGLLPERRGELLAFRADSEGWRVVLGAARMEPRVVAEVFNLLTIGDGLVGGSATIRFGIMNQGVQQLRVRLPGHWRNVEFIGPQIRRKDAEGEVWTIALQEKVWGGYTLVVTYDHAFEPGEARLDAAGAHAMGVERETGTTAVTMAANLTVEPGAVEAPLRRIDPTEMAAADRALITRSVLLAYRYEGTNYNLRLSLKRQVELPVLDAVTDRAQFTSVLTASGEVLTQAGFMVKNNERQFQEFKLPSGATLWGAAVNGEPVKADRDGDWVLVSLPRGEDRDQVFAVDLKYAQQLGVLGRWWPKGVRLVAPETRVPTTYAQWQLYLPVSKRVSAFGGNMTVARDTVYGVRDAWRRFVDTYKEWWHQYGLALLGFAFFALLVVALVLHGRRKGFGGVVAVLVVFTILGILTSMLLPALSKAKGKAQRIRSVNNLKQIGLAVRLHSGDREGAVFPKTLDELRSELGSEEVMIDPETGQRYTYVGAGRNDREPEAVIAYSGNKQGRREVLLADGSVRIVSESAFGEMLAKSEASQVEGTEGLSMDPALAARYGLAQEAPQVAAPTPSGPAPQAAGPVQGDTAGLSRQVAGEPVSLGVPLATGVKSLRIEIPKAGRAYEFTRVLSLTGEPPTVTFSLMSGRAFVLARTAFQVAAFLAGLGLMIFQWYRARPRATWLALGVVLTLTGLTSFFVAWRVLHLVFLVSAPLAALVLGAWLGWRMLRRWGRGTAGAMSAGLVWLGCWGGGVGGTVWGAEGVAGVPGVSVVGISLEGVARERSARLEAMVELMAAGTNQSLALFGREVAVESFTNVVGEARLWREGERVGVYLPGGGRATVQLRLLVKVGGEVTRRRLEFGLPAALGTKMRLTLDEADAEVDFPSALTFRRVTQGTNTVVEAVLGATDRVGLSWSPRLKRSAENAAVVQASQVALVTVGNGVVGTRAAMEWQVSQGELTRVRVAVPDGHRLLRVSGEGVRSWDYAVTNRSVVQVELLKAMSPSVKLVFELERALEGLPCEVGLALPGALGVKRETGLVAVRAVEELGLETVRVAGLERVDGSEFAQGWGEVVGGLHSAWRFLRTDFEGVVRVELLRPKWEVALRNEFLVDTDQLSLRARAEVTVTRAGVFALSFQLPRDGQVEAVECEAMQSWTEREQGGRRWLEVALKERVMGGVGVEVRWVRRMDGLPSIVGIEGLHVPGADRVTGFVVVSSEPGVGLKTAALEGAAEVAAATVPGVGAGSAGVLAYKYVATAPQAEAPWRLSLATEVLPPWVRAEVVSYVQVSESLVSGRASLRYEIQNAPVKEFRVRVPGSWRNVEFFGEGVRRRDQTNNEWRVELQSKVRGEYRLNVGWEEVRLATNAVELIGLEGVGVERETGAVAVFALGQLQVTPREASDGLQRIDARELPEWPRGRPAGVPVLSYRYGRAGWRLGLEARRFEDAAVLQALAERVWLRTVVADDGQYMTQMEVNLRNKGRQNLALALPEGTTVWSAFVRGQPVRPLRDGARLLLSLEGDGGGDEPMAVEMTYVGRVPFPRRSGVVELESPRMDVPLKDARWEVFLPPDHGYDGFQGTMGYESADLVPVEQEFTFAEYQRQEIRKAQTFETQALGYLSKARSELATGNYEMANKLGQLRQAGQLRGSVAGQELAAVEEQVKEAQSSNLIFANRAFAEENERRLNMDMAQVEAGRGGGLANYDKGVAAQQVAQLQKAQEVAVARVTPLRVNLPTRGLRHSFVQVLQTEVNKPLTVRMTARNQRAGGWVGTVFWVVGGLGAVWLLTVVALWLRPERRAA